VAALSALRPRPAARRAGTASHELTSLDERLGLLLIVRIGYVVLVAMGALFARRAVGIDIAQVASLSGGFLTVAGVAEFHRRSRLAGRMVVHRIVAPVDALYLVVVVMSSGGLTSPFFILFAVQLVSMTLLAGGRAGLCDVLWDTLLIVLTANRYLDTALAAHLGLRPVMVPDATQAAVAVAGLWTVAGCTAMFSWVSERELRRSKAEMSALAGMAAELEELADEDEILGLLLRTLLGAFPLRRAALWYTRPNRPVALVLESPDGVVTTRPVPVEAGADRVALLARTDREPRLVRRLDPRADPVASRLLAGAANVVVLPFQVDGLHSGLLLLEHGGRPVDARLPRRTLVMLLQFAGHAALALRNARLLAERERLAAMDGLTGLANRREFDQVLARETSRAERTGEPLSLIVLDVDHFKAVNDSRGHLGGDEVLRSVAQVLGGAVREMDLVARYGGDEFALVLPRCDQPDAVRVVERLSAGIGHRHDLSGVTVSCGVATIPVNAHDGRSLVDAADEALYVSKRGGRDRYSVSARRAGPRRHPFGPARVS
jgi:two-component system cell cycle response regulator